MKKSIIAVIICSLMLLCCSNSFAGSYPLTVAANDKGITVYASSSGSTKAGMLYNGFQSDLSVSPTNGRYSCRLTNDYTVWMDDKKAMAALPDDWYTSEPSVESVPSSLVLAEIITDEAPMYSTPKNRSMIATHAAGTLVCICGEFGEDYYVNLGRWYYGYGFVRKSDVRLLHPVTYMQAREGTWGISDIAEKVVYTDGAIIRGPTSATRYSQLESRHTYRDGSTVSVIADLGDWVQLSGGGFVEKRFLDPEGDHRIAYTFVKTSGILNRLNVR